MKKPDKYKKHMTASASAIETACPVSDGCYRKLMGERWLKLPAPSTGSQVFGTTLHSVAERWQGADLNGLGKDGKPVDIYPQGWEFPESKIDGEKEGVGATPEEQAVIKLLISKAIESGMLYRDPAFLLEKPIRWWEIMEGVVVNGFIDVLEPEAIVDHKTTKDMKWAKSKKPKSKNYLGKNIQMMLYAYWYYTEGGFSKEKPLRLRHNYFCKDPDKLRVEPREVWTTWEEVNRFWTSRIFPVLEQMKVYYARFLKEREEGISDHDIFTGVPLPPDTEKSCRKFGKCEFIKICGGVESVGDYRRRFGAEETKTDKDYSQLAGKQQQQQGGSTMSAVMDKLNARRAARAAQEGKTSPVAVVPPESETIPASTSASATPTDVVSKVSAPWYQEGCKTCSDSRVPGFRPDESGPCAMCKMMSKKAGGPVPEDFEYDITEGAIAFIDKTTGEEVVRQIVAKEAVAKTPEPTPPPIKKAPEAPQPEAKEETPAATAPTSAPPAEGALFTDVGMATEREKFEVFIECSITEAKSKGGGKLGSPSNTITGEELHQMVIVQVSKFIGTGGGEAGWYGIDPWTRKDAIMMYARQIVDMIGSSTVTVSRLTRASEMETIVSAIRPYARRVVQGLQG